MDRDRNDLTAPEGVTIRNLRLEDRARLAQLDLEHTGRSRTLWLENKIKRALNETDVAISLGAEQAGVLIGAVLGTVQFGEFGRCEPVAVLDTVLVDKKLARRGIARAMLEQLVTNLKGLRIARLRTEVAWDELELIAFFGKSGFSPAPRLVLEREL
ncbi:MAG: GNAT family N-acetyltransferase [Deltaproteobacteria bacterium]|nr:GNAT family N-acetyltransferase [Deltaproteobacteria bacterium]